MASNPFSDGLSVKVNGDTSGAQTALGNLQDKLGITKGKVVALGGALGTALAVSGMAKSTEAAQEFDDAITELSKRVGEDQAEDMRSGISEMAEEMPLTREELAGLADDAARFGVEGKENILEFTKTAAKMGEATQLSTEESSKSLAKLAEMTNTPVGKIENLGSAVNTLSNTAAASSDEIVEASSKSASNLGRMGLSQTDVFGLNTALVEVSDSASRAGTRMRTLAGEILDPKKAEDLAGALGMSVDEFENMKENNPQELMTELIETFGEGGEGADTLASTLSNASTAALGPLSDNMGGVEEALNTANKSFRKGTSLQSEFETEMRKTSSQIEALKSELRGIAIQIGENLLPIFKNLLKNVIRPAIQAFSDLNKKTGGMAGTVALLTTGIAGLVSVGAVMLSTLGGASAILGALGTAFTVLTGPIGIAIAAIALLATAWSENIGGIQEKTKAAFEAIKSTIDTVLTAIDEDIITPIVESLSSVWDEHIGDIKEETDETFEHIQTVIEDVIDVIEPTIEDAVEFLKGIWNEFGDEIMFVVDFAFGTVLGVLQNAFDLLLTAFEVVLNLIQGDWKGAFGAIVNYLVDTFNGLIGFAAEWGGKFIDAVIGGIPDVIKGTVKDALGIGDGTATFEAPQIESPIEQTTTQQQQGTQVIQKEQKIEFAGDGEITQLMADEANKQLEDKERRTNRNTGRSPTPNY